MFVPFFPSYGPCLSNVYMCPMFFSLLWLFEKFVSNSSPPPFFCWLAFLLVSCQSFWEAPALVLIKEGVWFLIKAPGKTKRYWKWSAIYPFVFSLCFDWYLVCPFLESAILLVSSPYRWFNLVIINVQREVDLKILRRRQLLRMRLCSQRSHSVSPSG